MGGGRGESGGRISPTCVGKKVNALCCQQCCSLYFVVFGFFQRGVLASEVCVFTTAFFVCIYIYIHEDIYIYTWFLFVTFMTSALARINKRCDVCPLVF